MLCAEQRVVNRPLDLVGVFRLARQLQQPEIQLHPGRRDASFAHPAVCTEEVIGSEQLAPARGTARIQPILDDVFPGPQDRPEIRLVAGREVQFEEPDEIRRHLVGLGIGDLVDVSAGDERGGDLRPLRRVPGADNVAAELEVLRVTRVAIEHRHRLQHAGVGHADVPVVADDALLAGAIAVGLAEEIADAARGLQRRIEAGTAIVVEQPEQVVLVRPDVPQRQVLGRLVALFAVVDEAVLRRIRPQIPVLELRGDEIPDRGIELCLQPRVAGVGPCVRRSIDELPDVLAYPRVLAGALAVALEDHVGVDAREQALAEIDRHSIAQQAVNGLLVERRGDEPRVDAGWHDRPHPDAAVAGVQSRRHESERCHERWKVEIHLVM